MFGTAYGEAVPALQILLWSVPFALAREVATVALVISERQKAVFRLTSGTATVCVALNVTLIPLLGLRGAALATVITEASRLALTLREVRLAGFALVSPSRLWRPAVAGAFMAGALFLLDPHALWVVAPAGMLSYAAGLALVGGVRLQGRGLPTLHV